MGRDGARVCCRLRRWSYQSLHQWSGRCNNNRHLISSSKRSHWSVRGVIQRTRSFVTTTTITSHSRGIFAKLARGTGLKVVLSGMFPLAAAAKASVSKHQTTPPQALPSQPPVGLALTWQSKVSNKDKSFLFHLVMIRKIYLMFLYTNRWFIHHPTYWKVKVWAPTILMLVILL